MLASLFSCHSCCHNMSNTNTNTNAQPPRSPCCIPFALHNSIPPSIYNLIPYIGGYIGAQHQINVNALQLPLLNPSSDSVPRDLQLLQCEVKRENDVYTLYLQLKDNLAFERLRTTLNTRIENGTHRPNPRWSLYANSCAVDAILTNMDVALLKATPGTLNNNK